MEQSRKEKVEVEEVERAVHHRDGRIAEADHGVTDADVLAKMKVCEVAGCHRSTFMVVECVECGLCYCEVCGVCPRLDEHAKARRGVTVDAAAAGGVASPKKSPKSKRCRNKVHGSRCKNRHAEKCEICDKVLCIMCTQEDWHFSCVLEKGRMKDRIVAEEKAVKERERELEIARRTHRTKTAQARYAADSRRRVATAVRREEDAERRREEAARMEGDRTRHEMAYNLIQKMLPQMQKTCDGYVAGERCELIRNHIGEEAYLEATKEAGDGLCPTGVPSAEWDVVDQKAVEFADKIARGQELVEELSYESRLTEAGMRKLIDQMVDIFGLGAVQLFMMKNGVDMTKLVA